MPIIHGKCPAIVDLDKGFITDKDAICRFTWQPSEFQQSIVCLDYAVESDVEMCLAILDFIRAYIERPREFRREPWMNEQAYKNWWIHEFGIDEVIRENIQPLVTDDPTSCYRDRR